MVATGTKARRKHVAAAPVPPLRKTVRKTKRASRVGGRERFDALLNPRAAYFEISYALQHIYSGEHVAQLLKKNIPMVPEFRPAKQQDYVLVGLFDNVTAEWQLARVAAMQSDGTAELALGGGVCKSVRLTRETYTRDWACQGARCIGKWCHVE